jgi:DNA-binding XRE family transcriptional regulator
MATEISAAKRRRLERAGWKIGSARSFLELTDGESTLVELRLALGKEFRALRVRNGLSQGQVAALLESSQSRIAKKESADVSVSLDLLLRGLISLGASRRDLAKAISA